MDEEGNCAGEKNYTMTQLEGIAHVEPKKKQKHRKDKPWDSDDIDHWKIDAFTADDNKHHLLEESSFATLFPQVCLRYNYRITSLHSIGKLILSSSGQKSSNVSYHILSTQTSTSLRAL